MKKIFAALTFTAMIFVPAFAQETVALTVDQALDLARERSRTLKSAQLDLEIKERASKYSWNVFLPTVTASFSAAGFMSVL